MNTRYSTASRKMSTAYKYEWLVIVPDKPGALENRLAARSAHLSNLKPRIESGQVVFGGAMLGKQPQGDEGPAMEGSVMLFKADAEEDVWDALRSDEYTKQGAWDVEKARVIPFRCAVRTAI